MKIDMIAGNLVLGIFSIAIGLLRLPSDSIVIAGVLFMLIAVSLSVHEVLVRKRKKV